MQNQTQYGRTLLLDGFQTGSPVEIIKPAYPP
jgi:hypothetical protein